MANPKSLHPLFEVVHKDLKTFYQHWIFIIYAFFRLFGFRELNYPYDKNVSHPPPAVRMSMVLNNTLTILLHNHHKEEADFILGNFLEIMRKAEVAFCAVTFHDYNLGIFMQNSIDAVSYMDEIAKNWNNVYPLIKPFAYGDLPPMVN